MVYDFSTDDDDESVEMQSLRNKLEANVSNSVDGDSLSSSDDESVVSRDCPKKGVPSPSPEDKPSSEMGYRRGVSALRGLSEESVFSEDSDFDQALAEHGSRVENLFPTPNLSRKTPLSISSNCDESALKVKGLLTVKNFSDNSYLDQVLAEHGTSDESLCPTPSLRSGATPKDQGSSKSSNWNESALKATALVENKSFSDDSDLDQVLAERETRVESLSPTPGLSSAGAPSLELTPPSEAQTAVAPVRLSFSTPKESSKYFSSDDEDEEGKKSAWKDPELEQLLQETEAVLRGQVDATPQQPRKGTLTGSTSPPLELTSQELQDKATPSTKARPTFETSGPRYLAKGNYVVSNSNIETETTRNCVQGLSSNDEDFFDLSESFKSSPPVAVDPPYTQNPPDVRTTNTSPQEEGYQSPTVHQERQSEINPSLYAPQAPSNNGWKPMVHYFNSTTRPTNNRRNIPVRQVFSKHCFPYETFNAMQSEMANMLAHTDDHLVLSAPTGAGKTAIFEMALTRFIQIDSKHRKVVYISPSKALCEERFDDWSRRYKHLSISLVTGDGDNTAFADLSAAQLIVTTPEKWDSLTRKWTQNFFLFATVKLYLMDEVHLIADPSRGCTLESIICRIHTIQRAALNACPTPAAIQSSSYSQTTTQAIQSSMRIVGVSATLPNIGDIAAFLQANEAFVFDRSFRPVTLTTHVIGVGYCNENNQYQFWKGIDREVPQIIHRFSQRKPTIVFCHSKAETEKLADMLATTHGIGIRGGENADIAGQVRQPKLQRCLYAGTAFHHAGLEVENRRHVEKAFTQGRLRVLCATSTLAMGVNLPAHLVVIKGTRAWRGKEGFQDLDQASLLQMIGRAGRPGFDTSGTAVIMTDNKSKLKFETLASSGLEPVQSSLLNGLEETFNTEVSQQVITGTDTALNWIKGTLYYVQLCKNPQAFGVTIASDHSVDEHLHGLCHRSIKRLTAIGALLPTQGQGLVALSASHIMSHHLVDLQAMELLVQLPFDANQHQLLTRISLIEGLHRPVRRGEKKSLNEMHKMVRYKLEGPKSKVRVKEPSDKVFVLLQALVGGIHVGDYAMHQEMANMSEYASRMLSALEEYSAKGSKHGGLALQAAKLRRCLQTKLWSGNDNVLTQIPGLGMEAVVALKFNRIASFADVLDTTEETIEKITKRSPPYGSTIKAAVSRVLAKKMRLNCNIQRAAGGEIPESLLCSVEADSPACEVPSKGPTPAISFSLIVFTNEPGTCLAYECNITSPVKLKIPCPPTFERLSVYLLSSLVGLDEHVTLPGPLAAASPVAINSKLNTSSKKRTNAAATRRRGPKIRSIDRYLVPKGRRVPKPSVTPSPENEDSAYVSVTPKTRPQLKPAPRKQLKHPPTHTSQITNPHPPGRMQAKPQVSSGTSPSSMLPQGDSEYPLSSIQRPRPLEVGTVNTPGATNSHGGATFVPRNESVQPEFSHIYHEETGIGPISAASPTFAHPQVAHGATSMVTMRSPIGGTSVLSVGRNTLKQPGQRVPDAVSRASWENAKQEQERYQQRAFSRKRDNPFSQFKHDPNRAESNLESLSQKTWSKPIKSLVPSENPESLESSYVGKQSGYYLALAQASSQNSGRKSTAKKQRRFFPASATSQFTAAPNDYPTSATPPFGQMPLSISSDRGFGTQVADDSYRFEQAYHASGPLAANTQGYHTPCMDEPEPTGLGQAAASTAYSTPWAHPQVNEQWQLTESLQTAPMQMTDSSIAHQAHQTPMNPTVQGPWGANPQVYHETPDQDLAAGFF